MMSWISFAFKFDWQKGKQNHIFFVSYRY